MDRDLLIVGAGVHGLVAMDIAKSMGCFRRITFIDDCAKETPNGIAVVGTTADIPLLAKDYGEAIVAIGNSELRARFLDQLEQAGIQLAILISPRAYVSNMAHVACGCIVEPMAVLNTGAFMERGCILSAGAVVNHCARIGMYSHVDCNATVAGNTILPAYTKVKSGEFFLGERIDAAESFRLLKDKK